jgi:hypothetical protein
MITFNDEHLKNWHRGSIMYTESTQSQPSLQQAVEAHKWL